MDNCKVCQRPKASKYNHYGATQICGSCRAFFMRASQSDLYRTFFHAFECVINAQNRRSCKKCRFEKCLDVGMRVSYVKTTDEKCQKIIPIQTVKVEVRLSNLFKEKEELEALHQKHLEFGTKIIFQCYCQNPKAFISHVCQPNANIVDTGQFQSFMDHMDVMIFKRNSLFLTDKDGISEDLEVLFRHNFVRMATFYNILLFMENWADNYFELGRKLRHESYDINQLMSLHDQFGTKSVRLKYDMFFASPWAETQDIEAEHERISKVIKTERVNGHPL